MINLDNQEIYKQYDPGGMLAHLHYLPQQCRQAWEKANDFALSTDFKDINKIVICGMGGSAIGGDLLRSLASNLSKPMVFVNREYELPAFVDSQTLVVTSSYSGNTEETLSSFAQALDTTCKKLAITTNGKLKSLAEEKGVPVFTINYSAQPRAALGYSFIPLLALLSKLGFLKDKSADPTLSLRAKRSNLTPRALPASVEGMAQTLEALLGKLAENIPISLNPAKQLASKLFGKLIVIYGAGIFSPVARRWKSQFNENSKAWAFYETFSELNHNAVVGYESPGEMADKIYVILLRSPSLHPRILARYQVTCEILEKAGVGHEIIDSQGEGDLTQMMSLVYLGDWVSYYLAMLYQTDPSPVKMIDYLKRRLSEINP
jgi:bifunctional phosphoglucose/phosphomannose isomerase